MVINKLSMIINGNETHHSQWSITGDGCLTLGYYDCDCFSVWFDDLKKISTDSGEVIVN